MAFTIPNGFGTRWGRVIDTADPDMIDPTADLAAGATITLESRSMMVLQLIE